MAKKKKKKIDSIIDALEELIKPTNLIKHFKTDEEFDGSKGFGNTGS